MSERFRKVRYPNGSGYEVGEHITDPAELERLNAEAGPDDGGTAMIVDEARSILANREGRRKPASAVPYIMGLLELLTPEQQLELAANLPAQLTPEARTKLAEAARACTAPVNGPAGA